MMFRANNCIPWIVFLVIMLLAGSFWLLKKPSSDPVWARECAVLPYSEFNGNKVIIKNVRNNEYIGEDEFNPVYETRTYDISKVSSLWFNVVQIYYIWSGPAHTFVSFGFDDGTYLSISVEVRKKMGQSYSALRGLFPVYKLVYVIGDERDVLRLRTNYRKNNVYLYPVNVPREKIKGLLIEMLQRANKLKEKPEFYNTLTNNCTNNIVRHVNTLAPGTVPSWSYRVLMSGYSDRLAYDLGLLDSSVPFDKLKARHKITEKAQKVGDAPDFSRRIRL